jgi:hypothetical protein
MQGGLCNPKSISAMLGNVQVQVDSEDVVCPSENPA